MLIADDGRCTLDTSHRRPTLLTLRPVVDLQRNAVNDPGTAEADLELGDAAGGPRLAADYDDQVR